MAVACSAALHRPLAPCGVQLFGASHSKEGIPVQGRHDLLIGIASVDITPPVGVTLSGYKPRISRSIGHSLRAEAMACRRGDKAWVLVASDTIGYGRDDVAEIRGRIRQTCALPGEAVMICATHTHSGPATLYGGDKLSDLDQQYLADLKGKLADVAVAAFHSAEPGRLETAWTEAPNLAHNRRVKGAGGVWTNEWWDPDGKHPGYVDPSVMLVGVRRPSGRLAALMVNYGCHPVTLGYNSFAISPDYPGYLKDALERQGVAQTVLFVNAGGGNVNPRVCIEVGDEHPRKMGEALAAMVASAVGRLTPVADGPLVWHREPWTLVRTREPRQPADRPGCHVGDSIPTEIQALRVGDLGLIGLPGELFSEYSRMLRDISSVPQTVIVQLANDCISYLPTDEAMAQGAYESKSAPVERMQDMIMEHAGRAFAAIAD
jgi:hypothetical protein